jgi:hypothetical protein
MKWDSGTRTKKFVVGRFVRILKASPPADIVDKNCFEFCLATYYILYEATKPLALLDYHSGFTGVFVCFHNVEAEFRSISRILSH